MMSEIELQRLLDGELDHRQRRRVLGELDVHSTHWRRLALALLEDQEFRRELGPARSASDESPKPLLSMASAIESGERCKPSSPPNAFRSSRRWVSLAFAASLLIGLGFFGGNWLAREMEHSRPSLSNQPGPSVAVAEPAKVNRSDLDYVSLKPVGQLSFSSDTTSGTNDLSLQVPMYEAAPEQVDQMLQLQERQVQAWNEQLRRRGYDLDWQPEMLESRLPDGRTVIVPVHQMKVRNVGQ